MALNIDKFEAKLFIDGKWVEAESGKRFDVLNPATGEVVGHAAAADQADVDKAVAAAKRVFDSGEWSKMPPRDRQVILNRFADLFEEHMEEIYELETVNNGRPIRETRAQLGRMPSFFRYFASLAVTMRSDVIPIEGPYLDYITRVPLGVCALMPSFNHPIMILTKSFAPALASGNSMVIKPSSKTPLTAAILIDLAQQAGIPDGVINYVTGSGGTCGEALINNKDVSKIVFTGSTKTGARIAECAAPRFCRTSLELGGKGGAVIFDDMEIERAVNGAAFASLIGAGQTCICGNRLIVQETIYEEFLEKFKEKVESIKCGIPSDINTQLGPVISKQAQERILGMIERAKAEGARVVTGGGVPDYMGGKGFYIEPTILADCTVDMYIAQTEIFGPVPVVIPFKDEADAIRIANGTEYGLGISVWTNDVARAHRVAHEMTFGMVWINDHHRLDPASPWGGFKKSGIGRETGIESFSHFTEPRATVINLTGQTPDWYAKEDKFLRLN